MQCLRDAYEVNAVRIDSTRLCRCDTILNSLVRFCVFDLLRACVGCDDSLEERRERNSSLAITSRTIPRQLSRRRERREIAENRRGVMRPIPRIIGCVSGEVILELHPTFASRV